MIIRVEVSKDNYCRGCYYYDGDKCTALDRETPPPIDCFSMVGWIILKDTDDIFRLKGKFLEYRE